MDVLVLIRIRIWIFCLCYSLQLQWLPLSTNAFYLPGSYPNRYSTGDPLWVKVNSLTSVETEVPFGYYTLPFCKPIDGIKNSRENLGELLMGDRIESSPYRFRTWVNETDIFLCSTGPLMSEEAKIMKNRIDQAYQVNLILDSLPAIRYTEKNGFTLRWTGYPVGVNFHNVYYIFNHLKFKVLVHDYEDPAITGAVGATGDAVDMFPAKKMVQNSSPGQIIVGFEVVPCSYQHNADRSKKLRMYEKFPSAINCDPMSLAVEVKEGESIVFSYEVTFEKSNIRWPSRWDPYLKMEGSRVHWFSIMNSLIVVAFLAGIVFAIFLRTVRRDLTQYEELDKEVQDEMNEEFSCWKFVVGDVFRPPPNADLLCILVGNGVQILGMGVVTIIFAAFGFFSPASRGALLTGMLFFYLVLGIAAGYVSVKLWRAVNGENKGWVSICWRVVSFFPGISLLILASMNFLLLGSNSSGAIPISLFVILILLWFCISVPLTLVGGYFGAKSKPIEYPVRVNHIAREVPQQSYPLWIRVIGAGTLPFGTLFIELYFIMSSLWLGQVYYVFGFLLIVSILLVIVCAEVSLVLTYMHLCLEDWRWWWQSFFSSGSVAIYILLYSISYLIFDLHSLSGPVSVALYLGYSFLIVLVIMLATGTVGFLSSFWFVLFIFSSVKVD
ncbi:Nonaspanin (TM9SF) [Macleaya cordata]|uniref:Transmembrane 9 superfamily member n=1 Tax=Macleaya cordata TaxID=56857 RepID=A0A200Q1S5_MACCD|nr:Nonaspanin (TM9SF) [Macleaya cordata]